MECASHPPSQVGHPAPVIIARSMSLGSAMTRWRASVGLPGSARAGRRCWGTRPPLLENAVHGPTDLQVLPTTAVEAEQSPGVAGRFSPRFAPTHLRYSESGRAAPRLLTVASTSYRRARVVASVSGGDRREQVPSPSCGTTSTMPSPNSSPTGWPQHERRLDLVVNFIPAKRS